MKSCVLSNYVEGLEIIVCGYRNRLLFPFRATQVQAYFKVFSFFFFLLLTLGAAAAAKPTSERQVIFGSADKSPGYHWPVEVSAAWNYRELLCKTIGNLVGKPCSRTWRLLTKKKRAYCCCLFSCSSSYCLAGVLCVFCV